MTLHVMIPKFIRLAGFPLLPLFPLLFSLVFPQEKLFWNRPIPPFHEPACFNLIPTSGAQKFPAPVLEHPPHGHLSIYYWQRSRNKEKPVTGTECLVHHSSCSCFSAGSPCSAPGSSILPGTCRPAVEHRPASAAGLYSFVHASSFMPQRLTSTEAAFSGQGMTS